MPTKTTYTDQQLASFHRDVAEKVEASPKLREMGLKVGFTNEDLASEALEAFLRQLEDGGGAEIDNPAAWMMEVAKNRVFKENKRARNRRESDQEPWSPVFNAREDVRSSKLEELADRHHDEQLIAAIIAGLEPEFAKAAAAAYHEGLSVRAVEKKYGISKSSVNRALHAVQERFAEETGTAALKRTRSRALAYCSPGFMTKEQRFEIQARMQWDRPLFFQVQGLESASRHAAILFPPSAIAAAHPQSLVEHAHALVDKAREVAFRVTGVGGAHDGAGLSSAFATTGAKIVAVCGTGAAAATCLATGVVPGVAPVIGGDSHAKQPPGKVASQQSGTATTPPGAGADALHRTASAPAPTITPAAQRRQEFGVSSAPSSAGTREFGSAPAPSGGGGGAASSGAGRQTFGIP